MNENLDARDSAVLQKWISAIEAISVDGWSRKASVISSKISHSYRMGYPLGEPCIYLHVKLLDLAKDGSEESDYGSRLYSKWAFAFSELFFEWISAGGRHVLRDGYCFSNTSNFCSRISAKGFAEVEYKIFEAVIFAMANDWAALERELALRKLGI